MKRIALAAAITLAVASCAFAQTTPSPGAALEGSLAAAVTAYAAAVERAPTDDNARFALGMAQSLRAAEKLAGTLYKFGLRDKGLGEYVPFLRLPVPKNENPEPVTAADLDAMLATFVDDMAVATKTLAEVKDPSVKLPVRVGLIHLDMNGDAPGGDAPAWKAIQGLGFIERATQGDAENFSIGFDLGDARWLEGYDHLLSSMACMSQAYEKKEIVERVGHLFFEKVKSPHALAGAPGLMPISEDVDIVDAIAFVHLINFPLRDAAKLKDAREHLSKTMACSRASWAAIRAETDNDREWIPNERQQTVVPNARPMTAEVIDGWLRFVDDCDAALNGKTLIPFWRDAANRDAAARNANGVGVDVVDAGAATEPAAPTTVAATEPARTPRVGRGINLRRVFDEPTPFDLVLWVQGSAATPYLEQGTLADDASYQRLERLLEGDFLTFAAWVN